MYVMRKLLKGRSGFTLVELMVVVVVLGILAGIAVQRMGDVRDRAETAAREANTRLLLGAANLAKTRNYGDYMYYEDEPGGAQRNATIRWIRPCEKPAVAQIITQLGTFITGYDAVERFDRGGTWEWTQGQEWNLTTYLESFPVGYAVEIVFAARDDTTGELVEGGNSSGPGTYGYHEERGISTDATFTNPYDIDQILIYKFVGNMIDAGWPDPFNPQDPGPPSAATLQGTNYPYMGTDGHALGTGDWDLVFPEN